MNNEKSAASEIRSPMFGKGTDGDGVVNVAETRAALNGLDEGEGAKELDDGGVVEVEGADGCGVPVEALEGVEVGVAVVEVQVGVVVPPKDGGT